MTNTSSSDGKMMSNAPTMIADYDCVTGENPLWHQTERRVYWTDIPTGRMFRYDPATGAHEQFYAGDIVGGFTFQADGSLLLFMARGAIKRWRDGELTTVVEEIDGEQWSRFNDVMADPEGRVFCGTMPSKDRLGSLYRLDTDGSLTTVLTDIKCSNGMGFTPDGSRMYYTDSGARTIYLFEYDRATGELTNRTTFLTTPAGEGVPDGMTVDADGTVWSARWDGWGLFHYDAGGELIEKIEFPVKKVSSVVFAGDDLTDMYMTTAGGNHKAENGDSAGALFHLNLGVKGQPEHVSRIRVD